ncbi:hypothetical protein [Gaopeijia maritima]|uniref:6-bladed beta-propeller n=1 Tax=Gaopeijia maritima TaxID=3119007 RepID=A0ABU9E737_9BACT
MLPFQRSLFPALLVFAACAESNPTSTPEGDVFDASVPRGSLTLEQQFGGADEREGMLFGTITHGVLLDDGKVALVDGQAVEIRAYDVDSQPVASYGGRGEGPGEFNRIVWLDSSDGSTLVGMDVVGGRMGIFRPGEPPRTRVVGGGALVGTVAAMDGVLPTGDPVVGATTPEARLTRLPPGEQRDTLRLLRFGAEGTDTLLQRPDARHWVWSEPPSSGAPKAIFSPEARVTVAGDRVVLAGTHESEWLALGPDGTVQDRVTPGIPIAPATPDDLEQARRRAFESDSAGLVRIARAVRPPIDVPATLATMRDLWAGMPHHDTLPAIDRMMGDRAGNVWVEQWAPAGVDSVTWTRVGSDYEPEVRLVIPADWWVLDAEGDRVLIRFRDELDRFVAQVMRVEGA